MVIVSVSYYERIKIIGYMKCIYLSCLVLKVIDRFVYQKLYHRKHYPKFFMVLLQRKVSCLLNKITKKFLINVKCAKNQSVY